MIVKLFVQDISRDDSIRMARELDRVYDSSIIFHCYWKKAGNGGLSEKHLYSILSFWHFNVRNNKHKIVLWLEDTEQNEYAEQIQQYAEIRQFDMAEQTKGTFLEDFAFDYPEKSGKKGGSKAKRHSDYVRLVLLYNYGGCWFDLDCFCLRSWDPLFSAFPDQLCFYYMQTHEGSAIANNAVVLSLQPKLPMTEGFIKFLAKRNKSWGYAENGLNANNISCDALILPIEWFDPSYGQATGYANGFFTDTNKEWSFDNFYHGTFCHHWHNSWRAEIKETSICAQLIKIIKDDMNATADSA